MFLTLRTLRSTEGMIECLLAGLCAAIVWLGDLGHVHGDLATRNLLLDHDNDLKLVDFEHMTGIGAPSDGNECPCSRLLDPGEGSIQSGYGVYGPQTAQFAIGSIAYFMIRCHEPYDDEAFRCDHGPYHHRQASKTRVPEAGCSSFG